MLSASLVYVGSQGAMHRSFRLPAASGHVRVNDSQLGEFPAQILEVNSVRQRSNLIKIVPAKRISHLNKFSVLKIYQ